MSLPDLSLLQWAVVLASVLLTAAMFLAFFRLARGPTLVDRVLALDLVSVLAVGIIAVFVIATRQPLFLDVAFVLALITFLGTVAFSMYLTRIADDE